MELDAAIKEALWIAFELVSSSYWKQLHTQKCRKRLSCELLSNLYLRHIENNTFLQITRLKRLWIAFELVSSSYWKQPNYWAVVWVVVVNCFRTCIFVILKTTAIVHAGAGVGLWIAFELVSSSYWKQRLWGHAEAHRVVNCFRTCIFVILKTTHSRLNNIIHQVVNCFRTCIFVILKTTCRPRGCWPATLWIAFELVSSSYWKQPSGDRNARHVCCELLSNLYLRHIENNPWRCLWFNV